ncbi:MAG: HAD-IC family P-type ATPase [Clostridia bacterium]|nr:HAD-IC family P-type ATPase [Clostridia bacterium]
MDLLEIPSSLPEDYRETPPEGLSDAEAAQRSEHNGAHRHAPKVYTPLYRIIAKHLFTFFNLLNVLLALCLVLVGHYRDMLFLGVVVSNTVIGAVQEIRARRTIERLQLSVQTPVQVRRSGKEVLLDPLELVRDDLVILRRGDQVPADALVREGTGTLNESLLTGESDEIAKHSGDWVLSGTYVTSGTLTCQLVYVGEDSYMRKLERVARRAKSPKSALMQDLRRLIIRLTLVLVPSGILLFLKQYYLRNLPLTSAVPQAVAAMIGMIPEGLMLLVSVALMVGVVRLGRKGALVRDLYGIETLARVDCLCLDKTGTLTTGKMQLVNTEPLVSEDTFHASLEKLVHAFSHDDSATMQALAQSLPEGPDESVRTIPFSSQTKRSMALFADEEALLLGAAEFVLDRVPEALLDRIHGYAEQGLRVLVLARAEVHGNDMPVHITPLGLVILADTLRDNLSDTFRYFTGEGVTIKLISGDDPRTVSAIARRCGVPDADNAVLLSSVPPDADYAALAREHTVFGRVSPQQKQLLVEGLKTCGYHVAMTGDGVNDIPALKAADCSIALPGGSEAAQHSALLTLVSGDFSVLPDIVLEGRRVINNVTRTASLFLVKTLYSLALCLLLILLPAGYPFRPIQLTLISSCCVGIPSFFLALEPNHEKVRGAFIPTVLRRAIPGAASVTLCAIFAMHLEQLAWDPAVCSTLAMLSAAAMGLTALLSQSLPLNRYRLTIVAGMAALLLGGVLLFGSVFYLVPLTLPQGLTLLGMCLAGILVQGLLQKHLARRKE